MQSSESAQLSFFLRMSVVSTACTKQDYIFLLPIRLAGLGFPISFTGGQTQITTALLPIGF